LTKVREEYPMMTKPLRSKRKRLKVRAPVTVCVAAMAKYEGNSVIVAASDRMVTAGDIEWEQDQRKIHGLTSAISLMVAGDLHVQTDILHELEDWKDSRLEEHPDKWIRVKDVAEEFYAILMRIKRKAALNAILVPLNLDYDSLVTSVSSDLQIRLSKEILDFQIAQVAAIVMGLDSTGVHIYVADNYGVTCEDWTGFTAVGGGAWHANSQLMFANHTKYRGLAETTMLVYTAKKRAEVAPGVGEKTDMVVLGPGLGDAIAIGNPLMALLEQTHSEVKIEAEKVRSNANAKINEFLEEATPTTGDANLQSQSTPLIEGESTKEIPAEAGVGEVPTE
jgi:20S proteasome alpha/beta subunit